MKITNIRTIQLSRPLSLPQKNAHTTKKNRIFNFVMVDTDAGFTGLGDAFGDAALIEPIFDKRLKAMAIGLDPLDIDALWRKLYAGRSFWEIGGSVVACISAIEIACWDICGKAAKVPVSSLIGGSKKEWIEAYASDLHYDEPNYMADLAKAYVDSGFRWVKTHIGAEPETDLVRLEAIRNAIGSEIGLMIDFNTAFDRETALLQGTRQAVFNPFWFEEPIAPMDYEGYRWLRQQLPMPIATGENLYSTYGFEPMIAYHGCDYIMPDILRCGGIKQTLLVCESAKKQGVIVSPHNYSSGVGLAATLHLMSAVPETQLLEFDPTGTAIYEELFIDPLKIQDGRIHVPTTPGLGVELTDEIIQKYR